MLKNKFLYYCLFAVLGVAAISCKKEPDLIGLDLLSSGELLNVNFTDTSTVLAYTQREDSVRTDELSINLLGSINDPVFGTTTASIYTQYRLSKNSVTFGANPVADSVVLTLRYRGIYGDSLYPNTIRIYEMADTMDIEAVYYSINTIPTLPTQIGEATFIPTLDESDTLNSSFLPVRVVLSSEFANKLITADTATLKDNVSFQKIFKGLYITSDQAMSPGTGSILYLDLIDAVTKVKLYYHNSEDTTSLDFPIGTLSARFNNYNHFDYAGADPLLLQQFNGDTTLGSQRLFIQAMAGSRVKLSIPYLKEIAANKRIAVNEALLIFKVEDTTNTYNVPAQLALRYISVDADNKPIYPSLPDENEGASYFDGKARSYKEYRFRITRYVQDRLLNPDDPDSGLMMFVVGSSLIGNRAILKGTNVADGKVKLVIYYTEVE